MKKTTLLAGLAAAAIAGIGSAQAAPGDWNGFYLGVNAGSAQLSADGTNDLTCTTACNYFFPANSPVFQDNPDFDGSGNILTYGAQAGWNSVFGSGLFWGLEADINSSDFSDHETHNVLYPSSANGIFFTNEVKTEWTATLRARLGIATDRTLLYVTGGAAIADATLTTTLEEHLAGNPSCGLCGDGASEQSDTLTGWTLGAGAEWAMDSNWSLKAEYLYEDFGSIDSDTEFNGLAPVGTDVFHSSADINASVFRVGINYGF